MHTQQKDGSMSQITATVAAPAHSKYLHVAAEHKVLPLLIIVALFLGLWNLEQPAGLTLDTWHMLIIFVITLISIIANILPMGALALIGLSLCMITKTLTCREALNGFSSNIAWLILSAFLLARGFIKSGLGKRVGYYFIYLFGKSVLGISYALVFAECILAPFIPSNTARGAGIIFPIIKSLLAQEQLNTNRMGAYLVNLCFQANVITSGMFLTAMAANPLLASVAKTVYGIELTWLFWAKAAIVPGLLTLLLLPVCFYVVYRPGVKHTPEAPALAKEQLQAMGAITTHEWIMIGTFALLMFLWTVGYQWDIDPVAAALLGLTILFLTRVLTWDDVLKEQQAWNTFIWLATLLMMSESLTRMGLMSWFGEHVEYMVDDMNWIVALSVIGVLYYYTHYLFASMTAHVSSLFAAFALIATAAGAPPLLTILLLCGYSSLCGSLTHYGTGTAPIYYDTGYLNIQGWWKMGFVFSLFHMTVWGFSGAVWWKVLGLW